MEQMQLVVFNLANFTCGIDIKRVQEIIRKIEINKVSTAPDFVKGVINLRGDIVTIIDLHTKLKIKDKFPDLNKRFIIANWEQESVGLQVDSICDIFSIDEEHIAPVPTNLALEIGHFFSNVFHNEDQIIGIIDIDALLGIVHG